MKKYLRQDSFKKPETRAKERVLNLWRGASVDSPDAPGVGRSRSVADVLKVVVSDLRLERRRGEAELVKVWDHLMDPMVVAHARPTGIREGTLFVSVDSNAWLDEILRYRRKEILERIQHSFGRETVRRISFRVG